MARFVCLAALLAFVMGACDWEPVARPVTPERVVEGQYGIAGVLDAENRYVFVTRRDATPRHFEIVDLRTGTSCALPPEFIAADVALVPPNTADADVPPVYVSLRREAEDGTRELWVTDPACELKGPFGAIDGGVYTLTIDDDQRKVLLWGDGKGTLLFADPWNDVQREIARDVDEFLEASRPNPGTGPVGEQALWILEGGQLVLRALDGTVRVRLGQPKQVSQFRQALFDTLHVAFVDAGDVYEAAGPSFVPTLIAKNACNVRYQGTSINLWAPCEDKQLIRIDLATGAIQLFEPGVFDAFSQGGADIEYVRDAQDQAHLFVTMPGRERVEVTPFLSRVQVLDSTRLLGQNEADATLGVWTEREGYVEVFEGVGRLDGFVDSRTNEFLYLMLHEVKDGLGRLSVFSLSDFMLDDLAFGVWETGYSYGYLPNVVPEAIVVTIQNARTLDVDETRFRGELHARFLSGDLEAKIDDDVTSYTLISTPLPGLLYSIESGPRRGLWFAAL